MKPYVFDATTGQQRWQILFDGRMTSVELCLDEHRVYGVNFEIDGTDYLYAVERDDGSLFWEIEFDHDPIRSPFLLEDTLFCFDSTGTLYGIDAEIGTRSWHCGPTRSDCFEGRQQPQHADSRTVHTHS